MRGTCGSPPWYIPSAAPAPAAGGFSFLLAASNLSRMKRTAWTGDELAFIRDHWEEMDDAALAVALNRPMSSVEGKRRELGLKRARGAGPSAWRYLDRHSRPAR